MRAVFSKLNWSHLIAALTLETCASLAWPELPGVHIHSCLLTQGDYVDEVGTCGWRLDS